MAFAIIGLIIVAIIFLPGVWVQRVLSRYSQPDDRYSGTGAELARHLLDRYGMRLARVEDNADIPGSHWGDSEAGLIGSTLYVRADTPLHSALHETCHYICMDDARRNRLHTDAGGDYDEENAVCFLQILLADQISGNSQAQLMQEMDAWGYIF